MRIAPQTFCRQTCSVWCITITLVSKAFSLAQCFKKWKRWLGPWRDVHWGDVALMRIAPQTFRRQTCYITITLVSKAFSLVQCFKKMKTLTSEGQNLCFLGPISTYQTVVSSDRITKLYNYNTCVESVLSCNASKNENTDWVREEM